MKKMLLRLCIIISAIFYINCDDSQSDSRSIFAFYEMNMLHEYGECINESRTCIGATDTYQVCHPITLDDILVDFKIEIIDCAADGLVCDDSGWMPVCQ